MNCHGDPTNLKSVSSIPTMITGSLNHIKKPVVCQREDSSIEFDLSFLLDDTFVDSRPDDGGSDTREKTLTFDNSSSYSIQVTQEQIDHNQLLNVPGSPIQMQEDLREIIQRRIQQVHFSQMQHQMWSQHHQQARQLTSKTEKNNHFSTKVSFDSSTISSRSDLYNRNTLIYQPLNLNNLELSGVQGNSIYARHSNSESHIVNDSKGLIDIMTSDVQQTMNDEIILNLLRDYKAKFQAVQTNSLDGCSIPMSNPSIIAHHCGQQDDGGQKCQTFPQNQVKPTFQIRNTVVKPSISSPSEFNSLNGDVHTSLKTSSSSMASSAPQSMDDETLSKSVKDYKAQSLAMKQEILRCPSNPSIKQFISGRHLDGRRKRQANSQVKENFSLRVKRIAMTSSPSSEIMSLNDFFNSILTCRGYILKTIPASELHYMTDPSPLQLASFGNAVSSAITLDGADRLTALLSSGLSLNPTNKFGESPFSLACKRGLHELVKVFVDQGAEVRVADSFGRTPLHYVAWSNTPCLTSARIILKADARLLCVMDNFGKTPLDFVGKFRQSDWKDLLDSVKDECWPFSEKSCEYSPIARDSTMIPDPPDALSVEIATKVASGILLPDKIKNG